MAEGQFTQIFPAGSGEIDGARYLVSSVSSGSPTVIHTTSIEYGTVNPVAWKYIDYVTVDAHNQDIVPRTLYLTFGAGGNYVAVEIPPGIPPVQIFDRAPLTGGQELSAWASIANKIHLGVRVERFQINR